MMTDSQPTDPVPFRMAVRSPEQALGGDAPDALATRLRSILRVTEVALAHLRLEALLDALLVTVREILGLDAACVLLSSANGRTLSVRAALGLSESAKGSMPVPIGEGVAGWVASHRRATIVDDLSRVEHVDAGLHGLSSAMAAPVEAEGRSIGVLEVGMRAARHFSDADLGMLQLVADRMALGIDRAREYERALEGEQRRDQEEQRYRSLFDNNPAAIFTLDLDGNFVNLNPAASRISGYSEKELLGQWLLPLVVEEDRERCLEVFSATVRGESTRFETSIIHKQGHHIQLRVTAMPIIVGGEVQGAYGIAEDMTEQHRAAADVRFLADVSSALHSTLDFRSTLRRVTRLAVPRFADWCVLDLFDAQGRPTRQEVAHVDPDTEARVREVRRGPPARFDHGYHPINRALRTGEPVLVPDVRPEFFEHVVQDPEQLELLRSLGIRSAIVVPLPGRERTMGLITFATADSRRRYAKRDLALASEVARRSAIAIENAELYAEAEAANRAKMDFLAVMSHELRTPLTAILGYAELLELGIPQPIPPAARLQVERIEAAARQQLQLIEEILTFSRLSEGQEVVSRNRTDLASTIEEAVAFIRPAAEKKGLGLHVRLSAGPCELTTDASKVRQILVNILFNAIQFTAEGEIEVTLECVPGTARIHVRDTGIGIEFEHQRKVFDAFWQVRQSSTREVGGTGLGLTVAQRIAHLLSGDITVQSTLGEGTTFTLHLPRQIERR